MLNKEGISELRERLAKLRVGANTAFAEAERRRDEGKVYSDISKDLLTPALRREVEQLRGEVTRLSVDIAGAARGSPLIAEADFQDLRHNTRRMLAALRFHKYRYRGIYVHHDEGTVLGVDPASQKEQPLTDPAIARRIFNRAISTVGELIEVLSPAETGETKIPGAATYRPNTAFIMMAIDKDQRELEDIKNCIKEVCKEFGVAAVTADDIQHEGAITDRVLGEIETNEFLIADLTYERPNVL